MSCLTFHFAQAVSTPPPVAPGIELSAPESDRGTGEASEPKATPTEEDGPETVFYRADDLAALHAKSFAASYGVESGQHLTETTRNNFV